MRSKSEQFLEASKKGDLSLVQTLASDPEVNVNFKDEHRDTPLTEACFGNHLEVVKFLLHLPNLNPNLPRLWGVTPLATACARGNTEMISLLLADQRVKVNLRDEFGYTPFHHSCQKGLTEVVALLLQDPRIDVNSWSNDRTPFYRACENGHVDVVSLLLKDPRVEVDKAKEFWDSPFIRACEKEHFRVISLLLDDRRIDVNRHNADAETPWFSACKKGLVKVVALLADHPRIEVNEPDLHGEISLSTASFNGRLSVVKVILAANREISGINVPGRFDSRGRNAVIRAQKEGTRPKFGYERDVDVRRRVADCPKIATLLNEYERDPEVVKKRLKSELHGPIAGELFALVVYLADDYLKILENHGSKAEDLKNRRFFHLAVKLPMDLQMLLCNRVFGLADTFVRRGYSEQGFRKFAKS